MEFHPSSRRYQTGQMFLALGVFGYLSADLHQSLNGRPRGNFRTTRPEHFPSLYMVTSD
jgi:hypothetical protein